MLLTKINDIFGAEVGYISVGLLSLQSVAGRWGVDGWVSGK